MYTSCIEEVSPFIKNDYNSHDTFLSEIRRLGTLMVYPIKHTILEFGDSCDGIYYIVKGMAEGHFTCQDGQERLLFIMNENTIFGECPYFNNTRSNIQVTVFPGSILLYLNENSIDYLIENNHAFKELVIKSISRKSQIMAEQLKDGYISTERRICKILEYICAENKCENNQCSLNITQNELAYITGLARVTVARICSNLKKYNIIENTENQKKKLCINVDLLIKYNDCYR